MLASLLFSIKGNTGVCLDGIKQSFAENSTIMSFLENIKISISQNYVENNGYIA